VIVLTAPLPAQETRQLAHQIYPVGNIYNAPSGLAIQPLWQTVEANSSKPVTVITAAGDCAHKLRARIKLARVSRKQPCRPLLARCVCVNELR